MTIIDAFTLLTKGMNNEKGRDKIKKTNSLGRRLKLGSSRITCILETINIIPIRGKIDIKDAQYRERFFTFILIYSLILFTP
jgi:hypothetical protein